VPKETLKIEPTGPAQYRILVGDHDISNAVRAFNLRWETNHFLAVELDLVVWDVTAETDTTPRYEIPPETEKALIALGWTPPPGGAS